MFCRKASAADIRGNNKHGRIRSLGSVMSVHCTDDLLKGKKKLNCFVRTSEQGETWRRNRKKTSGDLESGYSSMLESGYSSNRDSASENIMSAFNLSSCQA